MAIELVLGLGNPGDRYAQTRHNVGYDVVAEVLRRRGRGPWVARLSSELAVITPGRLVVLARPLGFMNRSGLAAEELLAHFGFKTEDMLVVVDDVDLPLGSLRLRKSGGPGTHNGLRDLCDRVGSGFPRLRVGVRGEEPWTNLADYVLASFTDREQDRVLETVHRAADAVEATLLEGLEPAMNRFNRSP